MKNFLTFAFVALICAPVFAVSEGALPVDEEKLAEEFAQLDAQLDAQLENSASGENAVTPAVAEEEAALPWLVKKVDEKQEEKFLEIIFATNDISINAENSLKLETVLNLLNENSELKVILKSYSAKVSNHLNEDRRESLRRALAVRKYFTSNGVDKTRISVKALGNSAVGDVKDKLEIFKP